MSEPASNLGRYRVQQTLGAGGMGIVYRAWDPQLERAIAIKVLKHARADAALRTRLVKEAQSLARLSHPNVCHVYDVGTDGDEVWVAMELIDGQTLRAWSETRTRDELLAALVAAAEGLHAAHAAGIIHRDVKPENVLVAADGRAVVTDFGLARVEDHVDAVGSTVSGDANATAASVDQYATTSGVVAGTPAYLAPEQLTGAPLDPRVDQFAWAVMAWELVTGLRPFPIVAGARLDAIRAGITPPPTMPKTLAAVLSRALAAAPRDRFPTMRALLDALTAPPPVTRRSRTPILVAAIGAVVIVGGVILWQLDDDDPPAGVHEPVVIAPIDAALVVVTPDVAIAVVADAAVIAAEQPRAVDAGVKRPRIDAAIVAAAPVVDAASPSTTATPNTEIDEDTPLAPENFPPIKAGLMENVFESMCTIPVDPSAKGLGMNRDLDWGRITRRSTAIGKIGDDMRRDMLLYELKGQRTTYRFDGSIPQLGSLHANVGDLVVVCPDGRANAAWEVPAGWENTFPVQAVLRLSAPPAIVKFAKLSPVHVKSSTASREANDQRLQHPASGHYFLRARAVNNSGTRWEMEGGWFLDVAASTPGASDMSTKRMWFVITDGRFDGEKLIYRAAGVIAQMFPQ